jgi:hypothetical protein
MGRECGRERSGGQSRGDLGTHADGQSVVAVAV